MATTKQRLVRGRLPETNAFYDILVHFPVFRPTGMGDVEAEMAKETALKVARQTECAVFVWLDTVLMLVGDDGSLGQWTRTVGHAGDSVDRPLRV